MALSPGARWSFYEILAPIGKGGMGEVYRARDARLNREVAIKILPEAFSRDAERMKRFEREAQVLASLNHPNIATLYGLEEADGRQCLVMELVEGETLEERIERGRLDVDEVLVLFEQVALGLEAAHAKGVVHRDLKPANVKIRSDGAVKILDFGLAKALVDEPGGASPVETSQSPTLTKGTSLGVILGTAPYMSPEQARGKPVDERTDIWAFAVCLYEALTGRRAFRGETVSDTIARILQTEPDVEALPEALRRLIRRCLAKDPARRLHDIADARLEIEDARTAAPEAAPAAARRPGALVLVAAAASALTAAVFWVFGGADATPSRPVTRAVLPLPAGTELRPTFTTSIAISPDGRRVAYRATKDGRSELYLRSLDASKGTPVDGSLGARMPFFSPDGQWIGFQQGGQLVKASVGGGAPIRIADVGMGELRGATWGSDGTIYFSSSLSSGISRVPEGGGDPEPVSVPDRERREKSHRYPKLLPGGKAVLFTLGSGDDELFDDASLAVLTLETGEYRVLLEGGTNPHYSPSGHLVYGRGGALFAVPFDLDAMRVNGGPVAVVSDVLMSSIAGNVEFDLSSDGVLVYTSGTIPRTRRLVWVDRQGRREPLLGDVDDFVWTDISPDGRSLAVMVGRANNNVWIYELARGTVLHRIKSFDNHFPSWSPGSDRVVFTSNRDGTFNVYSQAADGATPPERLTTSPYPQSSPSFSPDGKWLVYGETRPETGGDIWLLPLSGERVARAFVQTEFDERDAVVSPDGRFLAYVSNETGREETYLRSFPDGSRRWQVSTAGGTYPRWDPRGGEILYTRGSEIVSVRLRAGSDLEIGSPRVVVGSTLDIGTFGYSIAPGGDRILTVEVAAPVEPPREIQLVLDWLEELKRLVPTES